MHAIFFGLKRAFHSTLRIGRAALAGFGLTPARFDMLYALEDAYGPVAQSDLCEILGVTAATVSRMLQSLEDLGLVVRRRMHFDRRRNHVSLTERGLLSIRRAIRSMLGTGRIALAVDSALTTRWWDDSACLVATDAFETALSRVRKQYRDFATLHYPWHPDD